MAERSPGEIDPRPVDLPIDPGSRTPLGEYVVLLQRLHDVREELDEERLQRRQAEDKAWATVAERLEALAERLRNTDAPPPAARAEFLTALASLWEQEQIEVARATGRRAAEVCEEEFEVLCTQRTACAAEDGLVVETFRPMIRRRGMVIQPGQIIVARQTPSVEATS